MRNVRSLPRLPRALLLATLPLGCAPDPALPAPPVLLSTSVDDGADGVSPTLEIVLDFSTALDADSVDGTAIAVFEGIADEALARKLAHDGLTDALRVRAVPGALYASGSTARFTPLRPFAPDTLHTLVVTSALRAGGLRLARPILRPFTAGAAATGAPTWALIDPPSGAAEVVRNLRAVDVAFSRPVTGVGADSLLLVGGSGAVEATVAAGDCATCYRILPAAPLDGDVAYAVLAFAPIADAWGEAPFPLAAPPAFATSSAIRAAPPQLAALEASTSSGCLVARWSTDVAASGRLCVDGGCVEDTSRSLTHELGAPLDAGAAARYVVSSRDASTAPAGEAGPLATPPSSPRSLTITEVLGHPSGARLAQQFVELWNRGTRAVSTDGLELRDGQGGNLLPPALIPPGGYALIVPADFAVDDGVDVPVPAGTLLLRVDESHLGGRGFHEGGEAIAVVEADGRAVSRFSTYDVTVVAGQSVTRVGRCDLAASYRATQKGSATPGGP